ncbi:glycosyltransferase family 4 protein [Methanolobus sp. ZRKC5]|uniref:glycosyltransferase family 4 protein n=1 Tax=unclassified Methanolobus TaxID=2629569 RepID=UPI00313C0C64
MKIAYLINYQLSLDLPRGDAIHINNVVRNISFYGNDVFIVKKDVSSTSYISNQKKIYYVGAVPGFGLFSHLYYSLKFFRDFFSIIREEKPDVIHEREVSWRTYFNLGGLAVAAICKIPYFVEVNAPICYERGIHHSAISRKLEGLSEKFIFKLADRVIVVSTVLKNYIVSSYGINEEKVVVVPNGSDENIFNPNIDGNHILDKYGLKNKTVVCFSGSLEQEWQGIDILLKAAASIEAIDPNIKFLIIGDYSNVIDLVEVAPKNVVFSGRIKHADIKFYLAASDILLAPYILKNEFANVGFYNSPIKLFEYMAMGKSIISSNMGQIAEIIQHGENGLLIEPGDSAQLAEYILKLADDSALRFKLGYNARMALEDKYTWKVNAKTIMKLYEEVNL